MLFSVVIPVYNAEKTICECLDSVKNQTFDDWECICINDGSKDSSSRILHDYAEHDSRFVIIDKQNEGMSKTRNLGIDKVHGDWFMFMDNDDCLHPDCFMIAQSFLTSHPDVDGIVFKPICTEFVENMPKMESADLPSIKFNELSAPDSFFEPSHFHPACPWGKFFRTSKYGLIRFPLGLVIYDDQFYWDEVIVKTAKWLEVEFPIYMYRINPISISHRRWNLKYYEDLLSAMIDAMKTAMNCGLNDQQLSQYGENLRERFELCQKGVFRNWASLTNERKRHLYAQVMQLRAFPVARDFDLAIFIYSVCARMNAPKFIFTVCRFIDKLYGSGFRARLKQLMLCLSNLADLLRIRMPGISDSK